MVLNAGIIGCGYVAKKYHIPILKNHPKVRVEVVCDKNKTNLSRTGKKFNIENLSTNVEGVFDNFNLDIACICTPAQYHYEHSKIAIENGVSVLVEKPITTNLEQANNLKKIIEENDSSFCAVHNRKFSRGYSKAYDLYKKGRIGELRQINKYIVVDKNRDRVLTNSSHWSHNLRAGKWEAMLPHHIYIPYQFVDGLTLESVSTEDIYDEQSILPSDVVNITLASKGCKLNISMSVGETKSKGFYVHGTKETVSASRSTCKYIDGPAYRQPIETAKELGFKIAVRANRKYIHPRKRGHEILINKYIDYLLGKSDTCPVGWDEAYNVMELTSKISDEISDQAK